MGAGGCDSRRLPGEMRAALHRRPSESRWPRPCVRVREDVGEALTGVRAGLAIEPRNQRPFGVPTSFRKAEGSIAGRVDDRERPADPARSENRCMQSVSSGARTGRSRGRPSWLVMPRPGWFAGWHTGRWRAARGRLRRRALDERSREVRQPRSTCEAAEQARLHWPRRDGLKWPHLASVVVGVDVA